MFVSQNNGIRVSAFSHSFISSEEKRVGIDFVDFVKSQSYIHKISVSQVLILFSIIWGGPLKIFLGPLLPIWKI